jgi:hypothetical protein
MAKGRVIACGPLTKQPMTVKFRLVLIEWDDKTFSIHDQCFYDPTVAPAKDAYYLTDGEYFDINDLAKATRLFCKRLEKRAECLDSIYREQPCNSKSEPSSKSDTK